MFQINDKVVCVDATYKPGDSEKHSSLPELNKIYVVRDSGVLLDTPWVLLVGIKGEPVVILGERPFRAERFRKLSDIKAENALKAKREAKS